MNCNLFIKNMKHITVLTIMWAAVAAFMCGGCDRGSYRHAEGMVWHTVYHATYDSDTDLTDSILRVYAEVGGSLNVFDPESLASKINMNATDSTNHDYRMVYEMSKKINGLSGGAFDPTLGPLITAWGFGKGHEATSDTLRLDSLLQFTGIGKTRLENGRLKKTDPRIQFNYSAIAKGYGCDRVGDMLRRNGSGNYLVEIGGEIRCAGHGPSGEGWRVSIDRPTPTDSISHTPQCVISIRDTGLATSGNYRNYHGSGSGRYGHTISAATGRPVQTDVLSATVLAPTCMEADALATAMMAMGSVEAKNLAEKLNLAVMLILADGNVWETPEFTSLIVK